MAADGLMVFPGLVLDKAATIMAIANEPPWKSYDLVDVKVISATSDCGIVVYRAAAEREGEATYRALMSSVYARREGDWRLVLHQQTPVREG